MEFRKFSLRPVYTLQQLYPYEWCHFYGVPDHGSCHGMSRPMLAFYTIEAAVLRDEIKRTSCIFVPLVHSHHISYFNFLPDCNAFPDL